MNGPRSSKGCPWEPLPSKYGECQRWPITAKPYHSSTDGASPSCVVVDGRTGNIAAKDVPKRRKVGDDRVPQGGGRKSCHVRLSSLLCSMGGG